MHLNSINSILWRQELLVPLVKENACSSFYLANEMKSFYIHCPTVGFEEVTDIDTNL